MRVVKIGDYVKRVALRSRLIISIAIQSDCAILRGHELTVNRFECAVNVLTRRLAGDGRRVQIELVTDDTHHRLDAAGSIQILDAVFTGRAQFAERRRRLVEAVDIGQGEFRAGFLGDRFGIARSVAFSMALTAICFALFAFTPSNPAVLPLVILNVAISATFIFALRGIYFALLEEGGIPMALTGTAAGVASALGFVPDIYMPVVGGYLLDSYPGVTGYRLLFGFVAVLALVGFIAALLILRLQKSAQARLSRSKSG